MNNIKLSLNHTQYSIKIKIYSIISITLRKQISKQTKTHKIGIQM